MVSEGLDSPAHFVELQRLGRDVIVEQLFNLRSKGRLKRAG